VALIKVDAPAVTPVPLKVTVAPVRKFVPLMVMVVGPVPWVIAFGEVVVTVGAGAALTVNAELAEPPAVVTVTVPAPVVAAGVTVTGRVIVVALATVGVPPVTPGLLKVTAPPVRLVPVMVTEVVVPCTLVLGLTREMVGTGVTTAGFRDATTREDRAEVVPP
jgi:hypothetical protein